MKNYRREANWEAKWDKQDRKARIKYKMLVSGRSALLRTSRINRAVLKAKGCRK